jgi:hypothetical protein
MAGATVARPQNRVVFVSHRLQLVLVENSSQFGRWLQVPELSPDWFRRLDAEAAAWLSGSLAQAIQSGRLGDRAAEAQERLQEILEAGQLSGQLADGRLPEPKLWISWYDGCPDLPNTWQFDATVRKMAKSS